MTSVLNFYSAYIASLTLEQRSLTVSILTGVITVLIGVRAVKAAGRIGDKQINLSKWMFQATTLQHKISTVSQEEAEGDNHIRFVIEQMGTQIENGAMSSERLDFYQKQLDTMNELQAKRQEALKDILAQRNELMSKPPF